MAVTIADIQKLRKMTGAGLADCKKALTELMVISKRQSSSFVSVVSLSLQSVLTVRLLTVVYSLRVLMASLQWLPLSVKQTSLLLVRNSSI